MSTAVAFIYIVAIPMALFVTVLRLPRWFAGSLFRHAIWRLRDSFADEILDGNLPRRDPAVIDLLRKLEFVVEDHPSINLWQIYAWSWALKSCNPETRAIISKPVTVNHLSRAQREKLESYRARYDELAVGSLLCTSWAGVAVILRFLIPALGRVAVKRGALLNAANSATNEAHATDPGRRASAYLSSKTLSAT